MAFSENVPIYQPEWLKQRCAKCQALKLCREKAGLPSSPSSQQSWALNPIPHAWIHPRERLLSPAFLSSFFIGRKHQETKRVRVGLGEQALKTPLEL